METAHTLVSHSFNHHPGFILHFYLIALNEERMKKFSRPLSTTVTIRFRDLWQIATTIANTSLRQLLLPSHHHQQQASCLPGPPTSQQWGKSLDILWVMFSHWNSHQHTHTHFFRFCPLFLSLLVLGLAGWDAGGPGGWGEELVLRTLKMKG